MSEDRGALSLARRDGLPDALRVLLAEYPREAWESHPNLTALMRFWLRLWRGRGLIRRSDDIHRGDLLRPRHPLVLGQPAHHGNSRHGETRQHPNRLLVHTFAIPKYRLCPVANGPFAMEQSGPY